MAPLLVEDAQDGRLAADERQRGDADVDARGRRCSATTRPSWGTRRSAMSRSAMILMREIDAGHEAPRDARVPR